MVQIHLNADLFTNLVIAMAGKSAKQSAAGGELQSVDDFRALEAALFYHTLQ